MEEINFKNNSFRINDFTTYNYLILNIKNYANISFFIKDNSWIIHQSHKMIMIPESEWDNFITNIKNEIESRWRIERNKVRYVEWDLRFDGYIEDCEVNCDGWTSMWLVYDLW